jgi:hypothetical protein
MKAVGADSTRSATLTCGATNGGAWVLATSKMWSIRTAARRTREDCRRQWRAPVPERTAIVDDAGQVGRQLPLEQGIHGPRPGEESEDMKPAVAIEAVGERIAGASSRLPARPSRVR